MTTLSKNAACRSKRPSGERGAKALWAIAKTDPSALTAPPFATIPSPDGLSCCGVPKTMVLVGILVRIPRVIEVMFPVAESVDRQPEGLALLGHDLGEQLGFL